MKLVTRAHNKTFHIMGVPYGAAIAFLGIGVVGSLLCMLARLLPLMLLLGAALVLLYAGLYFLFKREPRPFRAFGSWLAYTRRQWDAGKR